MDAAAYCRARARHGRKLVEITLDDALRESLRAMARDYDELAEDLDRPCVTPSCFRNRYPNSSAHRGCKPPLF